MQILVFTYAVLTVIIGLLAIVFLVFNAIAGKNITRIYYTPRSENETEYGLRSLLLMYPKATIHTSQNPVSKRLESENSRIITHQEI